MSLPEIRSHLHETDTPIVDVEFHETPEQSGESFFTALTTNSQYEFDPNKPNYYHLYGQEVDAFDENNEPIRVFLTGVLYTQEEADCVEMQPGMQYLSTFTHSPTKEDIDQFIPEL